LAKMIRAEFKLEDARPTPSAAPVGNELDRLESMLQGMSDADLERTGLKDRLSALTARLGTAEASEPVDEFADVSDDELFDMIDSEIKGIGG